MGVGLEFDPIAFIAHMADIHWFVQIAHGRRKSWRVSTVYCCRIDRTAHLGHSAYHGQQQPGVEAARVIDAIVDDDGHQYTELPQHTPVAQLRWIISPIWL